MTSYGHRSNQSLSLQPPGGSTSASQQHRRGTSPMSSQTSLSLPDGGRQASPRPSSPLRHEFTYDSSTGIDPNEASFGSDDEEHPGKWRRSPSPSSSVSNLAASFVQRVNNFVGGMAPPRSPSIMPSDAELEAEAEMDRERSRREAEAILTREAQQRKQVEERVLAMLGSTKGLPPPPSRSQTMPPSTPSPSGSQKEANWWQAAKNKFVPTKEKESPTPAQQIIMEAKAREKGKGKEEDDTFLGSLALPVQPPHRKPVPPSPSSPTPSRPNTSVPNLSPSPMRATDSLMSNSPSREAPPTYAQFTPQGTLDVPTTLLAIAKRFEKLEKWTIGHVRALEDRMNDVERWLVDKEKEKEKDTGAGTTKAADASVFKGEMNDMRDEISELQGRVGELGREMAKMATSPSNLSSGPKTQVAAVSVALPRQASTTLIQEDGPPVLPHILPDLTGSPRHSRLSSTALDTTSPPLASKNKNAGTKLPYPTGDYNLPANAFSPPNSPPSSLNGAFHRRSSGSGLPPTSSGISATNLSTSPLSSPQVPSRSPNMARTESPTPLGKNQGLPPPKPTNNFRQSSVSPTPRKRYTVALGGPIVAPPEELQANAADTPIRRVGTPKASGRQLPKPPTTDDDDDDDDDNYGGETIGKSAAVKLSRSLATKRSTTSLSSMNSVGSLSSISSNKEESYGSWNRGRGEYKAQPSPSPAPTQVQAPVQAPAMTANRRLKAQSVYGFSSFQSNSTDTSTGPTVNTTAPLRLKTRAKSTERLGGSGITNDLASGITTATGGKFVDPLLRRQQEAANSKLPKSAGKVPIGQLVAFFDKDKKRRG